jgi:O-antigen ligase
VWYRSRLIDVALFEGGMSDHWLVGYGNQDLHWGARIDGRSYTDVVNHYLVILSRYGLVGLIPFLILITVVIVRLVRTFKQNNTPPDAWMLWCFSGTIIAIFFTINTVMLFGPPRTLFYILLALSAQLPSYVARRRFIYIPADYQPVTVQQPMVELES